MMVMMMMNVVRDALNEGAYLFFYVLASILFLS